MDKYDDKGTEIRASPLKGFIAVSAIDKKNSKLFQESFKGGVLDEDVKFPKGLGVEHPFDFGDVENIVNSIGVVGGGISKLSDSVVGNFTIKAKSDKAMEIVDRFTKNTDFVTVLRNWVKEGWSKGNGFMEIDLEEE